MSNNFYFKKRKLFFNEKLILLLKNRFKKIYESDMYQTSHSNIREVSSNLICKETIFEEAMNKIHKKFKTIINVTDLKFEKLWLVSSLPDNVNKNALPYVPHIDKQRYLKAMVYLHDVSFENGPIHFAKLKNKINIEQKRVKLPQNYKKLRLNLIDENHLKGNLIPKIGKAGDVIFFDTNTPHKAGVINKGYSRKVLRFDFSRPSFNSFKSYVLNKFFK